MRRLKIVHRTRYDFVGAVQLGSHRLLLRPREGHAVHIESSTLVTTPAATLHWLRDVHDNSVAIADFVQSATQLIIDSEVIVQHYDEQPLDFLVTDYAVNYPFAYDADSDPVLRPYMQPQMPHDRDRLRAWVDRFWRPGDSVQTYALLERLCLSIHQTLRYQIREEPGVQSATETLWRGSGSCRDFANLFMEAARLLGLAVRFVSGYLHAPKSDWDFGATHAWAEVYLPGAGWKGFDPTLGEVAGSKHIAVAVARLPESVSPVTGSYFGSSGTSLYVSVSVNDI